MNRKLAGMLAAFAGLAVSATALAGGLDAMTIVQPVSGDDEFAGLDTIVTFDLAAGLNGTGQLITGEALDVSFNLLDVDGNVLFGPFAVTLVGGAQNYNNAGMAGLQIDLGTVVFTGAFNNASVTGVELNVTTATGTGTTAAFDGADEANDQILEKDGTAPTLLDVYINDAGDAAFFVFDSPLNVNDAANDDNQTVIANIDSTDFQIDTVNAFDGTEGNPAGLSNFTFLAGSNFTTIRCDRNAGTSDLDSGTFVRAFFDAGDMAMHDIFDIVGNQADDTAVSAGPLTPLAIESAEFVKAVPAFGGVVAEALKITFNNSVTDAGTADFYSFLSDGDLGSLEIQNPVIDPDNPRCVLLDVDANFDFVGIAANGTTTEGDVVQVVGDADDGTTDPADIFGQDFLGSDTVDIDDGIEPQFLFVSFHDLNGDGMQDAAAMVFNESMQSTTSTDGLELTANDGQTVFPAQLIDPVTGELVEAETSIMAGEEDVSFTVTVGSVDADLSGEIEDDEVNNAIILSYNPDTYDWDGDGDTFADGDDDEAKPGTADFDVLTVDYTAADGEIADASGNTYTSDETESTGTDRAPAVLLLAKRFTGDNQNFGSNDQCFGEADGDLGDSEFNDRLAMYFSEDVFDDDFEGTRFRFTGGNIFGPSDSDLQDISDNCVTLDFDSGSADANELVDGVDLSVLSDNGLVDDDGNPVGEQSATVMDCEAPYAALISTINGDTVDGAFLIDSNDDGFADEIRIQMTQAIDEATLDVTDFEIDPGTVTGVGVSSSDARVIVISITDNVVSMDQEIDVTYVGMDDDTPIASIDGVEISQKNSGVTAQAVELPDFETETVAIQEFGGTITLGGEPAPIGTKIVAMIAKPRCGFIEATHNNVTFQYRVGGLSTENSGGTSGSSSLTAFTNWFLGLENFVYLLRDSDNEQYFDNDKDDTIVGDAILIKFNSNNISNITFTGTGESSSEKVTGGKLDFYWDVLRSSNGSIGALFQSGVGFEPILSNSVIDNSDGTYFLRVSAPISAFNGRTSRLDGIGMPVIFVVELPDGTRYAASSVLTSVNGAPVLFNPANRTQDVDEAPGVTTFNINLDNVGQTMVYPEWNLVPFDRASGWASSANTRPTLPSGVSSANVVVGTSQPYTNPVCQWVMWYDSFNEDGIWNSQDDDDNFFDSIVLDPDCFPSFYFTMTNFGVQFGSSMNNLVGGYALGFFVNNGAQYGINQFGAQISQSSVFPAPFSNSTQNRGWVLATITNDSTAAGFFTANSNSDYIIKFFNDGDSHSVDSASPVGGPTSPNDLTSIEGPCAAFIHYTR
ncbi:MAG: hypothetical protein KDA16_11785 [Phycisphaerales bacterium]|nr:hypothetical protein [Phycisphaerales bacterium]